MSAPGVALKVMRMFKCRYIEGTYWLEADMRLACYTGEWAGSVEPRLLHQHAHPSIPCIVTSPSFSGKRHRTWSLTGATM